MRGIMVVIALSVGVGSAGGAAESEPIGALAATRLWVAFYDGPSHNVDEARALEVSPDGSKLFVTGKSFDWTTGGDDYATVAFDVASGAQVWTARFDGLEGNEWGDDDSANALAASPDGKKLFVTGSAAWSLSSGFDFVTIAYNAASGTQLWLKRYNGLYDDFPTGIAVSPDGSKVFVTGSRDSLVNGTRESDYVTIAYDTATSVQLWTRTYKGATRGNDGASAVAVSPDGSKVFVTGSSQRSASGYDYATLAYDASTGAQLWLRRYNDPENGSDAASALAVSPDGSKVFVTGRTFGSTIRDYATIAYNAATGTPVWVKRYNGPTNGWDEATALGVAPNGSKLFVTGSSMGSTTGWDYATVAYSTSTGSQLWAKRYTASSENGSDRATALAVSPDGSKVFITGDAETFYHDLATIAYSPTGTRLWLQLYHGGFGAVALEPTPNASKIFVTGSSYASTSEDYTTVAYSSG